MPNPAFSFHLLHTILCISFYASQPMDPPKTVYKSARFWPEKDCNLQGYFSQTYSLWIDSPPEMAKNCHDIAYRENQPLLYRLGHWEQLMNLSYNLIFWEYDHNKQQFENNFFLLVDKANTNFVSLWTMTFQTNRREVTILKIWDIKT